MFRSLFIVSKNYRASWYVYSINILLVIAAFFVLFYFSFVGLSYTMRWEIVYEYRNTFIMGLLYTILLSVLSLIMSIFIGIFLAVMQRSSVLFFRILSKAYIQIIRGTPLLVQILVFFYIIADSFGLTNRFLAGIVMMGLFSGAFIAEIIRAGLDSVSKTQIETAYSLGFTKLQQYIYIIIPQVITRIIPPLTGQLASLIKDSSLLSVISIHEFTMTAREISANTYATLETYIPLAIGYLLITLPIMIYSQYLEKKFRYSV